MKTCEPAVYDRKRRPILPGDVVRMDHFRHRLRGERMFMYKYVVRLARFANGRWMLSLRHLEPKGGYFWLACDGRVHPGLEIVQGYSVRGGLYVCFNERKRKPLDTLPAVK